MTFQYDSIFACPWQFFGEKTVDVCIIWLGPSSGSLFFILIKPLSGGATKRPLSLSLSLSLSLPRARRD